MTHMRNKSKLVSWNAAAILFVVLFFGAVIVSVLATGLSSLILGAYLALSIMTFAVYAVDKSAATNDDYRVSEAILQYLSLAGGWPGALLAQQILRHKSKKASFRRVFWATVFLNCAALVWLHSPTGRAIFNVEANRVSFFQSGRQVSQNTGKVTRIDADRSNFRSVTPMIDVVG